MRVVKTMSPLFMILVPVLIFAGTGPRVSFEKDTHDYGRVMYGETISEEFVLKNTGDETLIIENVKSSCDCTRAVKGSSEVSPNGTSKIVASLDTTGLKPGRTKREITVHTNDPTHPVTKLTLLADVVRELTVDPPTLALRIPEQAAGASFSLKFSNLSDKPCTVKGLKVGEGDVKAGMEPETVVVNPRTSKDLNIKFTLPSDPQRQYYMGRMVLLTDHSRESEVDVRFLIHREPNKTP